MSDAGSCLIIGYGSIGRRHASLLGTLGYRISVLSPHREALPQEIRSYLDLSTALRDARPDYVLIANRTSEHYPTLVELAQLNYRGLVLVEKPILQASVALPALPFSAVFVGYNLRFHPVLQRLKQLLHGQKVLSVQAYVGQYLPEWRSGRDYRSTYSARADQGGGVLRDLSHELDYLQWLFGPCQRVAALGGHFSALEIDSADVYGLLLQTSTVPVLTVELNYLNRLTQRTLQVTTAEDSLRVDLVKSTLESKSHGLETFSIERDASYLAQHEAVLGGQLHAGWQHLCTLEQGLQVVKLIERAEAANAQQRWA